MKKYYCINCGTELIPKNEIARHLIRTGKHNVCLECLRGSRVDYANMPYPEYLETEKWKQKANDCKGRAGWRCQICNMPPPLDAHHRRYDRRGYEEPGDLTALCRRCHSVVHEYIIPVKADHPDFKGDPSWIDDYKEGENSGL